MEEQITLTLHMNMFGKIKTADFDYDRYWDARGVTIRKRLRDREEIFFDWIAAGSLVLDVAAGNSFLPRTLKEKKNCHVAVYDISREAVEKQKAQGIAAETADLSSDVFCLKQDYDYVILSEILEHLPLPENLIKKITPYAKFLVISVPNSAFYKFRLQLLGGRFLKQWTTHPSEHLRFWSHKDFLEWLDALGLHIIETKASNGLDMGPIKMYRWFPNLFGHQIVYLCKKKEF